MANTAKTYMGIRGDTPTSFSSTKIKLGKGKVTINKILEKILQELKVMNKPIDSTFFNNCTFITEQYERLYDRWSQDSQLLHIITEIAEVKDVLRNKLNKYGRFDTKEFKEKLLDEIADVFLTSFALTGILNINVDELNFALNKKLDIVSKRIEIILTKEKRKLKNE